MSTPSLPVVVVQTYEFAQWLMAKVENLPRSHRFTLGERMCQSVLDLLLDLTEASYRKDKAALLSRASRHLNALRILIRLAKDLKYLPKDPYIFALEKLDEIGRMIGGWSKAAANG